MSEIDILYEDYLDTLEYCGIWLLEENDYIIGSCIFEEFDIGVVTFFYKDNLKKLYDAKFISESKFNKSSELSDLVRKMQHTGEWEIQLFKTSPKWRKLLQLADEIKSIK